MCTPIVMTKCTQMFTLLLIGIYISVYKHTDSFNVKKSLLVIRSNISFTSCDFFISCNMNPECWRSESHYPVVAVTIINAKLISKNCLAFSTSMNAMSGSLASRLKCNKKTLIKADRYGILKLLFYFFFLFQCFVHIFCHLELLFTIEEHDVF